MSEPRGNPTSDLVAGSTWQNRSTGRLVTIVEYDPARDLVTAQWPTTRARKSYRSAEFRSRFRTEKEILNNE